MKHGKRLLCLSILGFCFVAVFSLHVFALPEMVVSVARFENNELVVDVLGVENEKQVHAICAVYDENHHIKAIDMHTVLLSSQKKSITFNFDCEPETVRVFLLEKPTLKPLYSAPSIEIKNSHTVVFRNENGEVLDRQTVYHASSARLPVAPEKNGFVLQNWSADVSCVTEDLDVSPIYIPDDTNNLFQVVDTSGSVGEEVTVFVRLRGTVKLCGFDMRLLFDTDRLEFIGVDSEYGFDVIANYVGDSQSVRFNYSSSKNQIAGGTVLSVRFRIKETGSLTPLIKLVPISILEADTLTPGNLIDTDYAVTEGVIYIQ